MINYEYISSTPLFRLLEEHPLAGSYLENLRLADLPEELPLLAGLMLTEPVALKEFEMTAVQVADELAAWLCVMEKDGAAAEVESVTIIGGRNKSGEPEDIELTVRVGEVISIVGPTGAGKSRLLEDIECLADGDTPPGRRVLINGEAPDRFPHAAEGRLVAELLFCMENKSPAGIAGRAFTSCSFLLKFHQTMDGMTDQIPNGLRSQA